MGSDGKPVMYGSRPKTIPVNKIRLDGDTQSRNELDQDVIKEYAALMVDGVEFPPVTVVFDGKYYWLVDGYHRRWAAVKAKKDALKCLIAKGTKEDARWESYGANKDHGLPRTREDKQAAIEKALKHPNGAKMADNKIAQHLGVSVATVGKYRKQLESAFQIEKVTERVGADGKVYETTNIGTAPKRFVVELPATIEADPVTITIPDTAPKKASDVVEAAKEMIDEGLEAVRQYADTFDTQKLDKLKQPKNGSEKIDFDDNAVCKAYGTLIRLLDDRASVMGGSGGNAASCRAALKSSYDCFLRWSGRKK